MGLFTNLFTKRVLEKAIDEIYAITEEGDDLDFEYQDKSYRISKNSSSSYISLWEGKEEQAFSSLDELTEHATINGKPFMKAIWDLPFADLI